VVVIIREDLIGKNESSLTPTTLSYKVMNENDSLYNTPPTYSIYVANLIFEWILKNGGIQEIEKKNKEKSNLLYDFIDNSNLFL
jgi:phosphoserine aminotransferase